MFFEVQIQLTNTVTVITVTVLFLLYLTPNQNRDPPTVVSMQSTVSPPTCTNVIEKNFCFSFLVAGWIDPTRSTREKCTSVMGKRNDPDTVFHRSGSMMRMSCVYFYNTKVSESGNPADWECCKSSKVEIGYIWKTFHTLKQKRFVRKQESPSWLKQKQGLQKAHFTPFPVVFVVNCLPITLRSTRIGRNIPIWSLILQGLSASKTQFSLHSHL